MKLLHGFDEPASYRGSFVSIGNFDGVHRGHQSMIACLLRHARVAGVPAVVVTFNPHPITLLRPTEAPPPLSTFERKMELLAAAGVDCTIAYPTDRALLQLTPADFFEQIVLGEIAASGLVEGPNFFYGRDRTGNPETLRESCQAAGLRLEIVPPVRIGDRLVSSSVIRSLIAAGDVTVAAELLGHRYRIRGLVTQGAARGRAIGFPTANLSEVQTLLPLDGVYAAIVPLAGRLLPAAVNLGPNPTFGEERRKIEVHILDYSGDLYGAPLDVEFIGRIRDTIRFTGKEQLIAQLQQDLEQVRSLAKALISS